MSKVTRIFTGIVLMACSILLASCGHTLESESGLYNVTLESSYKIPLHGFWFSGNGAHYTQQKTGSIYVAPLDVSVVRRTDPEAAAEMQLRMREFVLESLGESLGELNQANHANWTLTNNPAAADLKVDMAIVHYSRQRPGVRILTNVISNWSPIPMTSTLASPLYRGDVCMELTIRNNRTGALLMAVKDENPGAPRYFRSEAYSNIGNGTAALRIWAAKLARIIRECAYDRSEGKNIRQRVEEMDLLDAATLRVRNAGNDLF